MTSQLHHGLYIVPACTVPQRDTQALANQIVARIERDFALANLQPNPIACLPLSLFQPRRDTPVVVLRRVLNSLYSFAFSA